MTSSSKLINKDSRQPMLTIGHQFNSQNFQSRDISKTSINSHNCQKEFKNRSCPRVTSVKVKESSKFSHI